MRDLTSQVDMQDMFTGAGAPFVALIISPYYRTDKVSLNITAVNTVISLIGLMRPLDVTRELRNVESL